jgi:hypothetical protein
MRSTVSHCAYLPMLIFDSSRCSVVNTIVVVGHERLHVEMQRLFGTHLSPNSTVSVVKVPKSGGVRSSIVSHDTDLKLPSC